MNNLQKRKLRQRLVITMISILSCIAVMAVGVYAASKNFEVTVTNQVSIEVLTLNGTLTGRRGGDVIYGTMSRGDAGLSASDKTYASENADTINFAGADDAGYINLYGIQEGEGFSEYTDNLTEIEKQVNFYTSAKDSKGNAKDSLTIYYVFKFVFDQNSDTNVTVQLQNSSTQLSSTDSRKDKISMTYKYYFGTTEPTNWATSGTSFGVDNGGTSSVKIEKSNTNTHTIYVYASMTVQRTNTLKDAYTIGMGNENYHWKFGLTFLPEFAS